MEEDEPENIGSRKVICRNEKSTLARELYGV